MRRNAFTLVELLVSISLIVVLSSMVLVGLSSAQKDARIARTRSLLQRIDEIVQSKFDEYRTRRIPIVLLASTTAADTNRYVPADSQGRPFLDAVESSRVRLVALRDLMRMEMPDRISDITTNPQALITIYRFQTQRTTPGVQPAVSGYAPTRIDWQIPSRLANYRLRVGLDPIAPDASSLTWTREHESAECLWLFLSATSFNGIAALEMISPSLVKDTDNDGIPEIVDAWGTPITWVRWPAGSTDPVITNAGDDEFDLLGSDWGHHYNDIQRPTELIPMIMSAGPDGELGIVTAEFPLTPYGEMTWPVGGTNDRTDFASTGVSREFPSNSSRYPYIDPFARQYSDPLPGSRIPNTDSEPWADNLTNFGSY